MGSATTQARAVLAQDLSNSANVGMVTAQELFAAARAIGDSGQLSGALTDTSATAEVRGQLSDAVFAGFSEQLRTLLRQAVALRWSDSDDLSEVIEELAIRAVALANPQEDLEAQLFNVSRVVASHPDLELALGSRLGDNQAKAGLIGSVLNGTSVGPAVLLIVTELAQASRGRRARQLLDKAMRTVSSQRERVVATVHTARALSGDQHLRLTQSLQKRYGTEVALNVVIDPALVGGLRIQVADDVIDGSISARLADLRLKLAS